MVVDDFQQHLRVVDVRTGAVDRVALSIPDETFPSPAYAADLWANDLVDGVPPDRVHDPRWDMGLGASGLLGALLVAGLVVWGRRRRVRP